MKPSSILKLIAGFGLFLIIGVIALVLVSRAKPISPPPTGTDNSLLAMPAQIKVEIVKTSDIPDDITEEYVLRLKVSFVDKNGVELPIFPQGMLNIKLFSPNPPHKMGVMEKVIDKWISIADSEIIEDEARVYIYLKSGFKVAELTYFLSLSIEYDAERQWSPDLIGNASLPKPPLLRYDIPLYKY